MHALYPWKEDSRTGSPRSRYTCSCVAKWGSDSEKDQKQWSKANVLTAEERGREEVEGRLEASWPFGGRLLLLLLLVLLLLV